MPTSVYQRALSLCVCALSLEVVLLSGVAVWRLQLACDSSLLVASELGHLGQPSSATSVSSLPLLSLILAGSADPVDWEQTVFQLFSRTLCRQKSEDKRR